MPIFNYKCECGKAFKRILSQGLKQAPCPKCGALANRDLSAMTTSSQQKEIHDNGIMPKRVEALVDVQTLVKERSK